MLTETQLLLLSNLIYRKDFIEYATASTDNCILVESVLKVMSNSPQATMSTEEWDAIYAMARSDQEILDLKVTNVVYEKHTGAKMACFVDKNGQAYAVFAGTGANEWRDDCVAGTMTDSPQQQKALDWFESLPYENVVVTGHSKGGNKAMYVSIVSDKAGECFAFDGEGFSREFCEKYKGQIEEKKQKIHLSSNYKDFVNTLLVPVAGDIKYIVNDTGVANASEYHAPNALFKYVNGEITYSIGNGSKDSQDPAMEMLGEFTRYLLDNATEAEKILALSVLGELLTDFLGGADGVVREDILEIFGVEAFEIIIRYLTKYLQELGASNPAKYFRYRDSFGNYTGSALGRDFWKILLGVYVIEPFAEFMVFDRLADGTILMNYKVAQMFTDGNIVGRDFSQEIKEVMLRSAREVEEEKFWQVTKWDCWYRVEKFFGNLQWDHYTGEVDKYFRKIIDINNTSVKEIENIFTDVYEIDIKYSNSMSELSSQLSEKVLTELKKLNEAIVPVNLTSIRHYV